MTAPRPAVFLDRDGTIIVDAEYLGRADGVRLLPGAATAIARLNRLRLPVIVVTNQSGIARGRVTAEGYEAVRRRLDDLLAEAGAYIDATYVCPHHPDFTGPCQCRKPGTLLYQQAARDHDLDLTRSTFIGDRWRDVAPALALGGRGILIVAASTPAIDREQAADRVEHATSLADAVERMQQFVVRPGTGS